jgi:hypothetical protein
VSPSLIEIAEDAAAYRRPAAGDVRLALDDVVLVHRPSSDTFEWHEASRLRLPRQPQKRIDEIRAWFRSQGCTKWMWTLGPSSTPTDLERHIRVDRDVTVIEAAGHRALVLDHEPPSGPDGVDIREVRTFDAFCGLDQVQSLAFGESAEVRAEMITSRPARWDSLRESGDVALLAYLDGIPVAGATMAPLQDGVWLLLGGATIPEARGRGLYRALVRGRWAAALEHGGVAMITHAGSMSAPILLGLGFVDVGRVDLLFERDS